MFGDSCIFLHDRSDYKAGWEQEIDWEKKQQRKMERRQRRLEAAGQGADNEISDSTDDEVDDEPATEQKYAHIAEKCPICSSGYKSPTILECGHIFCEGCALHHYSNHR